MQALFIILGVLGGILLLLLLLLLLGIVRVRLRYGGQKPLKVTVSLLRIPITLVGKQKKAPPALKDPGDPHTLLRREERKMRRYLKKQEKQDAKKREKQRQKALKKELKKREKAAKKAAGVPSPNLRENLSMILELIKRFYAVSNGRMRVKVNSLRLSVGTDDAAKTAILYGTAVQLVNTILEWLDKVYLPITNREKATVVPDFVTGKIQADVDIVLSLHLRHALAMGVRMLLSYREESKKANRKARQRVLSERKQQQETAPVSSK